MLAVVVMCEQWMYDKQAPPPGHDDKMSRLPAIPSQAWCMADRHSGEHGGAPGSVVKKKKASLANKAGAFQACVA
jgi:hypothetical protein